MDLEFGSSIPCTPLLLSTSLTSLAHQSLTGATQVAAVIIATQGAGALSPCHAAPCCRGDHPATQLAIAPHPASPSTTPRPLDTGIGRPRHHTPVPVHAQRRPSSHRARAERPPLPSSRHATPRPHFCSLATPHRSNTVATPYGELSRPCTAPRTASTVHRPSGYKATPSPPFAPHSTPAPLPHSTLSRAPPGGRSR